ncbi:TonB-linked SusC/RagA family outer membrane protein [Mucilaginibacter oryzae]|uniref:TonB-linked SusC/RagA family outer membrane protein n=2 Tax=Mucilaginibacter oryzae TaxID=468058 RepID=A0A316HA72_9SPHI|nr:TonB-linked SusC/RagA family outer membrane protein [Mucilaginibacter oryzae]
MYKNCTAYKCRLLPPVSFKLLLTMKLTFFFMICTFLQLSATTYAQKITISKNQVPLKEIFNDIRQQTSYKILYNSEMVKNARPVTIDISKGDVKEVLDKCLFNQDLTYEIIDNTIIIKQKTNLAPGIAQEITVSGKVTDIKGEPIPGVNIVIKGSRAGTITDTKGNYKIKVPDTKSTLVFSFIGFATKEIAVGDQSNIDVILIAESTNIADVVVIGYGTQKRGDLTGAISSIRAKDIANSPQVSVDQMLQGKAAGLTISQNSGAPGSNTSVRVRGVTSLSGSNEPLYVIDGVPISGDATNQSTSGRSALQTSNSAAGGNAEAQTSVSPLSLINPSDIESIDVLKDASATAIYGNRASNGVIIITTKRGKTGKAHISYDGYAGIQNVTRRIQMMDLRQYATLQNALGDVYGTGRRDEFADPTLLGKGTNWQDAIFRTAIQQSHQVSVSGGKDGVNYYLSGGYLNQDGIIIGSNFNRYNLRTNIDAQVNDWFKLGISLTGSHSNERVVVGDNNGIVYNALLQAPDLSVTNPDGSYTGPPANDPRAAGGVLNPVAQALNISNILNRNNINTNLYNDIRLYKDLTLRSELGGDFNFSDNNAFTPTYTYGRFTNPTATLNERFQQSSFMIWKEYLNYTHKFGAKNDFNAVLGHEAQKVNWRGIEAGRQGFYSNDVQTLNLGQAITATNDEYKGKQTQESYYARVIYTYNNKYSLTSTIRQDISSKFAAGHRTGYFPSFAAFWRMSEEPFMRNFKNIADNVKIRLGYGQVGNQEVPNNLYNAILSPAITGLGTGFQFTQIPSEKLKWQTSIQYNAGLDFSILKGRVDASVDFYDKTSKNFIFQLTLPAYVLGDFSYLGGINAPYVNLGKLDNRGVDISINSRNIATDNFKWNTSIVFSRYKNTVKELGNGLDQILGSVTNAYLVSTVSRTVVGGPIGEFYGYKVKGIFKTTDQLANAPIQFGRPVTNTSAGTWLGDVQYVDVNKDGKIDENDRTDLGNPNPKFTYGITNNFSYKAFDLGIFLNGSYGSKILSLMDPTLGGLASTYQNQYASVANFWTPQNSQSDIPAPKSGIDNPNLKISDRFIHSGSYLRIQNINLGWKVPSAWIRRAKLSSLRIYSSVQNLYTFTSYKGFDPELGSYNQNAILTNIDIGRYPIARTVTFGVNAQF